MKDICEHDIILSCYQVDYSCNENTGEGNCLLLEVPLKARGGHFQTYRKSLVSQCQATLSICLSDCLTYPIFQLSGLEASTMHKLTAQLLSILLL